MMSYLDEIIAIGKDFRNETIVTNNDSTSLRAIWTYIGNTSVKFKRDVTPCCFSSSSRSKCTIDLKNRLILHSQIQPNFLNFLVFYVFHKFL